MLSNLVIGYLFCGGAGAGACVLLAVIGLLVPRGCVTAARVSSTGRRVIAGFRVPEAYRRFIAPAFGVASLQLAIGALLLVADLGIVGRAQLLFAFPTPTFLTVGAFALVFLLAVATLLAAAWGTPLARMGRRVVVALHWAALALGLVVAVYTGLLLSSLPAVPFWSNAWLPALFVVSALSCGCATVLACASFSGSGMLFRAVLARVSRVDAMLLVVEALVLVILLASSAAGSYGVAREAALSLAGGDFSVPFYGAVVILGLVLPLALEGWSLVSRRQSAPLSLVIAASVLIGGFALRYCVVTVGAHPEVWAVLS